MMAKNRRFLEELVPSSIFELKRRKTGSLVTGRKVEEIWKKVFGEGFFGDLG